MMEVIIPLRVIVERPSRIAAPEKVRIVRIVLEQKVKLPPLRRCHAANRGGELDEEMGRAIIEDGVHRVEAQPVEPIFAKPEERVVNKEVAHRLLPEVD